MYTHTANCELGRYGSACTCRSNGGRLHPRILEAIQVIDSAVLNSDAFDSDENRAYLQSYIERWSRVFKEH